MSIWIEIIRNHGLWQCGTWLIKIVKAVYSPMSSLNQSKLMGDGRKLDQYDPSERLLKPISSMIGYNSEMKELVGIISRVILWCI